MRRVPLFLLLSTLFISSVLHAQTGKIAGKITDKLTDDPLIGVNVIVEGTSLGAATDVDGYYTILNVLPGNYSLKASYIGYAPATIVDLRVNIDQTTEANIQLSEETIQTSEVVVVAVTPIVQKDVAASGVNLNAEEIQNLPVVNVQSVIGLQAGVQGETIRGGTDDEVVYQVNGVTMRDGRDNTAYSNISFSSVQQIKLQTGGFTADVGDARSGVIEVVTKEGGLNNYSFTVFSQIRPAANKHFGQSVNDPNSFFIRPYVDDAVAWTGTDNGAWSEYIQRQYPNFEGWDAVSEATMQNDNPDDDLTPEAAQRLFLWQYRKTFDITQPDYNMDMSFGGPVPVVSKSLGNLRFFASFIKNYNMLLVPLSTDNYTDYDASLKLTSDLATGMKLMLEGHWGQQSGTGTSTSGLPGIFRESWYLADRVDYGNYTEAVLFSDAYFTPTTVDRSSLAAKFTHVISPSTFYDVTLSSFRSDYSSQPGRPRDLTLKYKFGNNYYADEAPIGYYQGGSTAINPSGMQLGSIYSQSRDQSKVTLYNLKFDFNSQLDQYNNIKTGLLFRYSDNNIHYGLRSLLYSQNNRDYVWDANPILAAVYVQDKLEFEAMVATIGVRVEYSDPNTDWYVYNSYDPGFSAANSGLRDEIIPQKKVDPQITVMPRIGIAFPISVDSKIFLNYGHYQTLPVPANLYRITDDANGKLEYISNPQAALERTISYELGYEHNLFDQYLLRVTGYYKDISNESRSIGYTSSDGLVSYTTTEPVQYRDIRGFEFSLQKNRGNWIIGFINYTYMATSLGKFGWGEYYQSPVRQEDYIRTDGETWLNQSKPLPIPVARANIDLFTPNDYGPEANGFWPLAAWRLNILATWQAGDYTTWTNGAAITAENRNNLQWLDYFNTNLRLSKSFFFGAFDLQLYVQINNLFDTKRLSTTGFSRRNFDQDNYYRSLHLPESAVEERFGYINIPGDDQPGDYREEGAPYTPIQPVRNINDVGTPAEDLIYYDSGLRRYYEFGSEGWQRVDDAKMNKILQDKSYIDMPNFGFFTFLNPRDVFFGMRLNITF